MLRFFIALAVVFALPFIAYSLWRMVNALPNSKGEAAAPAPTQWLALAGAVLALITVAVLTIAGPVDTARDGVYQPPRIEDGRIVPGRFDRGEDEDDAGVEPRPRPDPPSRQ